MCMNVVAIGLLSSSGCSFDQARVPPLMKLTACRTAAYCPAPQLMTSKIAACKETSILQTGSSSAWIGLGPILASFFNSSVWSAAAAALPAHCRVFLVCFFRPPSEPSEARRARRLRQEHRNFPHFNPKRHVKSGWPATKVFDHPATPWECGGVNILLRNPVQNPRSKTPTLK